MEQAQADEKGEVGEEGLNESQTSLVGDSEDGMLDANQGIGSMSPAMKKDRDNHKRKIQTLEKKLKDEDFQNRRIIQNKKGEFVEYGNIIQIMHVQSQCYI